MIFATSNLCNQGFLKEAKDDRKISAYFSIGDNTTNQAKTFAEAVGANLCEIRPLVPYREADLDWGNHNARSTVEMNNRNSRSALADKDAKVEAYDLIFVGFPIWWYIALKIINTFLESYDFGGKTELPFTTSVGSGFERALENLRDSVWPTTQLKLARVWHGHPGKAEMTASVEILRL